MSRSITFLSRWARANRRISGPERRRENHDDARPHLLPAAHFGQGHVAGFDVVEQPLEVKNASATCRKRRRSIPKWRSANTWNSSRKLKGIPSGEIPKRVNEVCERTAIGDVRKKLIGKLSKGYRQRVGIAQAIIHNPPC